MDRSIIPWLLGALFATAVSARAELQLIPSLQEFQGDGGKFKQLAFSDGDKTVTYQAPIGWDYSGDATQLILHPPKKTQAEATITRFPLSQPGAFDDETLKKLVDQAVALVPKESQNVVIISQEKNPLLIDRKETFLVVLSYNSFGQAYNRSILFLNRGNEQIRFQLVCRQADFKGLQRAFLGSQYTWQNL
jgi:hypothetical protein